jgi:DNA (cytosine-5)-methyltransferase 1
VSRKRFTALELFCGVGGMTLGFADAGFRVVAAFDSSAEAISLHKLNFPSSKSIIADVTLLTGREVRRLAGIGKRHIDVVFGGPPCQGFSYGGKHRRVDPRNSLIQHFARLVVALKPSYFVMENVRGLLAPRHSWRIASLRRFVRANGYEVVWPLSALDASAFGVPQVRERVFLLGHKRSLPAPQYPSGTEGTPTVWDAIGDLDPVDDHPEHLDGDRYSGPLGAAGEYARLLCCDLEHGLSGFAPTLHGPDVVKRFSSTKPGRRDPVSRFHRLDPDGVSYTLRAGTGPENGSFMAPRPIHPTRNRCIYPREAARLHSFPDWFEFDDTLWHSFRQIGNSVPPKLARAVAEQVAVALRKKRREAT